MAGTFDPYHKWLGISPKDQPPNYYRLLNIELFESDLDVIEGAADRQMAHVRTFQTGQHSADSQRLLNELSAARISLLDPEKRAAYDRSLRAQNLSHLPASQVVETPNTVTLPPPPVVSIAPAKAIVLAAIPVQATSAPVDFCDEAQPFPVVSGAIWKHPVAMVGSLALLLLFLSGMAVALALRGNQTATNNVADSGLNQTHLPESIPDRMPVPDLAEVSEQHGPSQKPPGDQSAVSPVTSSSIDDPIAPTNDSPAEPELAALVKLGARITRAGNGYNSFVAQIDLSHTPVADDDLVLLKAFPGLSVLRLESTQITDAALQQLEGLIELRMLYLRGTHVTDLGLSFLEKLPKLSMLDLRNTGITGEAIVSFRRSVPRVNVISDPPRIAAVVTPMPSVGPGLAPPAAKGPDLSALVRRLGGSMRRDSRLPDKPVVELRIDNDIATDDDLEFLQGLTALMTLELHGMRLTDKTLGYLKSLPSLTSLSIERGRITDKGLECLADLKRLVSLRIRRALITDTGLKHLKELAELEFLDLGETQITGSGLGQLRTPQLKTLVLDKANLSDKTIGSVARFAQLHSLSIQDTKVGDQGLAKLRRLKMIKVVNVSGTKITQGGIGQFRAYPIT